MESDQLKLVIESVLFVADGPVDLKTLARLTEAPAEQIAQAVGDLATDSHSRGVRIQQTGNAVQMVSAPETARHVQLYLGIDEHQRLSPVVLVTLTVIAYKQPITKGDVERILNKNCDYSVMTLKARGLIAEVGRTDGAGRPYLYGTTFKFLEHFGLEKPEDLPPLPELEIAAEEAAASAEEPVEGDAAQTDAAESVDTPGNEAPETDAPIDEGVAAVHDRGPEEEPEPAEVPEA